MAKPNINIQDEYNSPDQGGMPPEQAAEQEQSQDIEVTAEQMTIMKQLAADGNFEELGKLTAQLLNATAPAAEAPMM